MWLDVKAFTLYITASNVDPETDPEVDLEIDPEIDLEIDPEIDLELDPVIDPEIDPEIDSEIEPEIESERDPKRDPKTSERNDNDVESVKSTHESNDPDLPQEVLLALGDPNTAQQGYGDKLHPDILKRIENIIISGMNKEIKEALLKKYLIPENCTLLDAPKINLELLGILKQSGKARDNLLQERQQELGVATGTVCKAIHLLLKEDFNKLDIIKMLTDSSRLLSNLHFQYTEIRRKLISPFIDKDLSRNLKENQRAEFLYTKLDDTVKSLTTMKRASNIMKPKVIPATKNSQAPRRTGQSYQGKNVQRGGHRSYRQQQPRPQFKQGRPQDRRQYPSSFGRGRAKYP